MRARKSHQGRRGAESASEDHELDRVWAECSSDALQSNYQIIRKLSGNQDMIPMIKADGYGHGAAWVARQLLRMPGLYGFGVATFQEAIELREELGGRRGKVIVFSGAVPWTEEKGRLCEKYGLTAVIASDEDWFRFFKGGWASRISYELKFNTGMNRLGIQPSLAKQIMRSLRGLPSVHQPDGVLSHLAIGESPEAKISRNQRECFAEIRGEFASALKSVQFHLANSAAIWNEKLWGLDGFTDLVRPGLALYGIPPWVGAPARGLTPVMTLKAAIIALRTLKANESIGYGATFTVPPKESRKVAILSAGYADGLKRALSNRGSVWVDGELRRWIGIVSMDLSAVGCGAKTRVGDSVEILGSHIDPWEQAQAAGTIPYELLTSVSPRVQRVYV